MLKKTNKIWRFQLQWIGRYSKIKKSKMAAACHIEFWYCNIQLKMWPNLKKACRMETIGIQEMQDGDRPPEQILAFVIVQTGYINSLSMPNIPKIKMATSDETIVAPRECRLQSGGDAYHCNSEPGKAGCNISTFMSSI